MSLDGARAQFDHAMRNDEGDAAFQIRRKGGGAVTLQRLGPHPSSLETLAAAFGPKPDLLGKRELAAAARGALGTDLEQLFTKYVEWVHAAGYRFRSFETTPPILDQPNVYLRYDVHLRDLLPAFGLADLHERLGIPGSFQVTWRYSVEEEKADTYFASLRAFERCQVDFGLHCAPATTWFIEDAHGGDQYRAAAFVGSPEFEGYLDGLFRGYEADGPNSPELRAFQEGAEGVLDKIAVSFRTVFGNRPTISAHGNFLSAAFIRMCAARPEFRCLDRFFCAEPFLRALDLGRYGFAYEITTFPVDKLPGVATQYDGDANLAQSYRRRMVGRGGFVSLFHPFHWKNGHLRKFVGEAVTLAGQMGPTPVASAERPAGCDDVDRVFTQFASTLIDLGYKFHAFGHEPPDLAGRRVYLRHDVSPADLDIQAALRLAAVHERLRIPGNFHLAWDAIEQNSPLKERALHLRQFDPEWVRLGLLCDPISGWLAQSRFDGDESRLNEFIRSAAFTEFIDELLAAWRAQGKDAPALRAIGEGAWGYLLEADRSFRVCFGRCSSISRRGLLLSNSFFNARRARPELSVLEPWLNPIVFLAGADLAALGYRFEATSFAPDNRPGPAVMFGGVDPPALRTSLHERMAGGDGFVAIFPTRYWAGERYMDLLRPASENLATAPVAPPVALPERPVLTNLSDLKPFGPKCERVDRSQLARAARLKVGGGVDFSFLRFVDWLRSEGYSFGGFEDGPPRFGERVAYLRYDVHAQDLLAAYILAELHERLGIIGSFQISWMFSRHEEATAPYFEKLLEFDRRFVQFGLHAAPTATWYINEKHGGDPIKAREVIASDDFVDWLRGLHAAFLRDGDDALELREIRAGTDDTLSRIATSFRETFGVWKTISGHGNAVKAGFMQAQKKYPDLGVLEEYFHPVAYMEKYGVRRFGFDYEVTAFGVDRVPFPRVMMEGVPEETRRRWLQGRVANGAGFVALLHPANWTCRHNATFFLPAETGVEPGSESPKSLMPSSQLPSAIVRLREIVRNTRVDLGEDPDGEPTAGNIEYNSTGCGLRAGRIAAFLEGAYGFSMRGKAVCELGSGFGGLCLHWALEHGATSILAVDVVPYHVGALRTLVREFGLPGFTVIESDLQEFAGHEETIDAVVLNDVMYTSRLSPDRVAAACARVLRPGGVVLFRNVNRAYGPFAASHREGTQFLDPDSADRAARFIGRGAGSTLAHRPLSPAGLAAFLRQAGFDDFRLDGDTNGRSDLPQSSKGLQSRYLLAGRKTSAGAESFCRMAPQPDGVLDLAPFREAIDREAHGIWVAAGRLRQIFGTALSAETADAELREYLVGRLLMDGLRTFRVPPLDTSARDFANAIDRALDHALVAILSRHAGWAAADFSAADPEALSSLLQACVDAVRRDFQQPDDGRWSATVDWQAAADCAIAIMLPHARSQFDAKARVALLLRHLVDDHLRLRGVGLLARTADPVTGSLAQEYAEAAIERMQGEVFDTIGPEGPDRNVQPACRVELVRLVEQIEAHLIPAGGGAALDRTGKMIGSFGVS